MPVRQSIQSDPSSEAGMSSVRKTASRLLVLAESLSASGRMSGPSKSLFKETVLRQDKRVLLVGENYLEAEPESDEQQAHLSELLGLVEEKTKDVYDDLFAECDLTLGHQLASKDAEAFKVDGTNTNSMVYGEVSFSAFFEVLLEAVKGTPRLHKFYDLGSGTGRAVFEAVLAIDCEIFIGVEVLPSLHAAACDVADRYVKQVEPLLANPPLLRLYNGDILATEYDWSDGDLVFANSTCFEQSLLHNIARIAEKMKPGARIITFTVALQSLWLRVIYKKKFNMSWGPATVYIHQKLSEEEYTARLKAKRCEYDDDQAVCYGDDEGDSPSGTKQDHQAFSDTDSVQVQAPSFANSSEYGDDGDFRRMQDIQDALFTEEAAGNVEDTAE